MQVMSLFQRRDGGGLGQLLAAEPRAVRHVYGRLWDSDEGVRRVAAEALGIAGSRRPDLGRELLRRVVWGLQDEAATNGGPAIPVLAEIAIRAPEVARPFVGPVVSLMWDDGLRPEIRRVVDRLTKDAPELIAPLTGMLEEQSRTGESRDLEEMDLPAGDQGRSHGA